MSKNSCSPPADLFNYYPASHQDNDVAVYRNQGGSGRSTSNTVHKDLYRQSGGMYGGYPNKNVSYLPGGGPNLLYVKKYIYYNIECQIIGEKVILKNILVQEKYLQMNRQYSY